MNCSEWRFPSSNFCADLCSIRLGVVGRCFRKARDIYCEESCTLSLEFELSSECWPHTEFQAEEPSVKMRMGSAYSPGC